MKKKTFKYRLFPSKKQITLLNKTLNECRWLYNHLLEERKSAWEEKKESVSCFDQCNTFKYLKQERQSLKEVHSQILQNVAIRIDLAFRAFFRRVKQGEKSGYPRFRGRFRYDSFCYPQSGFKLIEEKSVVQLSKIGRVKIKLHRPIEGQIKTCIIRRTRTDKWFVTFSCQIEISPISVPIQTMIGIDVGLESFATLSDGTKFDNPRFFRKEEKNLAKAQRLFSKTEKGSAERAKRRRVVCHIHERIADKRSNFVHQLSRKLVDQFDLIAIEDLSINQMQKNNFRGMNKSIGDAAWAMFGDCTSYKAEWAGKTCVKPNPAYTSQDCSDCGNRQRLKLSDRVYHCLNCGLIKDRDRNAAINILRLGMQSLGLGHRSPLL